MKTKNFIFITAFIAGLFLAGCDEVLDKENLTAVNPSQVFSNATIARAYLNNIYTSMMPGNPIGGGNYTDESVPWYRQAYDPILNGTATIDSWNNFPQYNNIRTINILLAGLDNSTFDEVSKKYIRGEGLFWRAWAYHSIVLGYGGVPLILEPQSTSDLTTLALPRNKTSECVTQIVKDLDDAIANLPEAWTGSDIGRIDKGVAMAFKGRVLLFYASPLFNGLAGVASWQKAYDANSAAITFLDSKGKGLFSPFNKIWDNELNKEQIMIRRYNYPQATYTNAGVRPLTWSSGNVGQDKPTLELVDAFPMKDGSAWNPAKMAYDTLFKYRDDRFYETVYYNGSPYQYIADMVTKGTYLWTYMSSVTNYESNSGIAGKINPLTSEQNLWSLSSFHRIKALDKTITASTVGNAAVDWPEIRYAEVLMNYGEAANELGKTAEALAVLYRIRARAGILPGTNSRYGITAATTADIRTVYQNERFVEFAFEGKRLNDLRRWKKFDYLRGLGARHGLGIVLKPGQADVKPMDDINVVWNKFTYKVINCEALTGIQVKDDYYFYGIPKAVSDRNAKLVQNNNWGGSFDPLQ